MNPVSFENALTEAEMLCHLKIAEVLGLSDGVDAFICLNPGRTDCAVWDIGGLQTGEQTGFPAEMYHFRGQLELYSRSRQQIQRWIMRLIAAFPLTRWQGVSDEMARETCVDVLRIAPESNAVSAISTTEVHSGTNEKTIPCFTATLQFDIVFGTGARSASEA